jgi:hypothetical protein
VICSTKYFLILLSLFAGLQLFAAPPVPFSGKLAVDGTNFHGNALFSFSVVDGEGTVHWKHANKEDSTIENFVMNGRYLVLLGGQGMQTLPADLFLQHESLFLRVLVDLKDGKGMRLLEPDQRITSSPYALSAEIARLAERAQVAGGVDPGAITADMLAQTLLADLNRTSELGEITRDMLPQDVRDELNATITRDRLSADVRADLNRTIGIANLSTEVIDKLNQNFSIDAGSITLDQLSQQVRDDINRTITRDRLSSDVLSDINRTITKSMLSQEVLNELNATIGPSKLSSEVSNALKPVIVGQPSSVVEHAGMPTYLAVDATGGGNTYQWKKNGVDLVGATSRTLSISDLNASQHEGNYTVVVSNAFGSVTSSVAHIDVNGSLTEGLVGWWKFDETEGAVASDSSGNGNDGNLTNGPTWTDGKIGGALSFDGVDDFVDLGNNYNNLEDLTLSAWVKFSQPQNLRSFTTIIANRSVFVLNITTAGMNYSCNFAAGGPWQGGINSNSQVRENLWDLVTCTRSDGNVSLLVNTLFEGSTTNAASGTSSYNTSIGNNFGTSYYFSGLIDDIRIYDRALSAVEVKALYELGEEPVQVSGSGTTTVVNGTVADGSIGPSKLSSEVSNALKPVVVGQPSSVVGVDEQSVVLDVDVDGVNLSYQWKKNGVEITGATGRTLSISDLNASQHEGNYTVVVSNAFGSVTSSVAQIDVNGSLTEGLVGWWKFDETEGNIASDSSGNGNDGNLTITNGPWWTSDGKLGGALNFNGIDNYVLIPGTSDFDISHPSISAWVYSDNFYQNGFIFEKTSNGNLNSQYSLFIQNGFLKFRAKPLDIGYSDLYVSSSNLRFWSFISAVYDGQNRKIYVNGDLLHKSPWSETITTNPSGISLIGAFAQNSVGQNYFFNGLIDDVRIYDRALSAFEVKALYELGEQPLQASGAGTTTVVNGTVADGSITTNQLSEQILKYLKPEIIQQPTASTIFARSNHTISVSAEGKYLTYQWKKNGANLLDETNATLTITDANSTQHDGNYSVVVSNDFGSVESGEVEVVIRELSPLAFSGVELWLDASDAGTLFSDTAMTSATTGSVAAWADKSGNNFNLAQPTASKQPSYDALNRKVSFNTQYLTATPPTMSQPITSFIVLEFFGSNTDSQYVHDSTVGRFLLGESGSTGFGLYSTQGGGNAYWLQSSSFSPVNKAVMSYSHNGAMSYLYHNGILILNGTVGSDAPAGTFSVGVSQNLSGSFFNGSIYEFVIYSGSLSTNTRQILEGYLSHKHSLDSELPNDHPYKNAVP